MNILIVGPIEEEINLSSIEYDYVIAIDGGVNFASKLGLNIDFAIGDFDSIKDKKILENLNKIILDTNKDDTDFEHVLSLLKDEKQVNKIYGIGLLYGSRLDHLLLNILLLLKYNNLDIKLISNKCEMFILNKGKHILKYNKFKYVSFFSFKENFITLKDGFKYKVSDDIISLNNLKFISNEIIENKAIIEVSDSVVTIFNND